MYVSKLDPRLYTFEKALGYKFWICHRWWLSTRNTDLYKCLTAISRVIFSMRSGSLFLIWTHALILAWWLVQTGSLIIQEPWDHTAVLTRDAIFQHTATSDWQLDMFVLHLPLACFLIVHSLNIIASNNVAAAIDVGSHSHKHLWKQAPNISTVRKRHTHHTCGSCWGLAKSFLLDILSLPLSVWKLTTYTKIHASFVLIVNFIRWSVLLQLRNHGNTTIQLSLHATDTGYAHTPYINLYSTHTNRLSSIQSIKWCSSIEHGDHVQAPLSSPPLPSGIRINKDWIMWSRMRTG